MTMHILQRLFSAGLSAAILVTSAACATTTPPPAPAEPQASAAADEADAEAARATVRAVIAALEAKDLAAFKAHLSKARLAGFDVTYFDTWVSEIEAGSDFQAGAVEKGAEPDRARVVVSFQAGSAREEVRVRLAREDDRWRWDER